MGWPLTTNALRRPVSRSLWCARATSIHCIGCTSTHWPGARNIVSSSPSIPAPAARRAMPSGCCLTSLAVKWQMGWPRGSSTRRVLDSMGSHHGQHFHTRTGDWGGVGWGEMDAAAFCQRRRGGTVGAADPRRPAADLISSQYPGRPTQ